jgi:thermostable 8-oxoguanine DNA glycosylase
VIALDVRVVGALKKYFEFNLEAAPVQARRDVYLSVEGALRGTCAEAGKPLALLDQALFQLSGMSELDFVVRGL